MSAIRSGTWVLAVTLAVVPVTAAAKLNPCTSRKIRTAGQAAFIEAKCYAKAVREGVPPDTTCQEKPDGKISAGFAKAESRASCLTSGDADAIRGKVHGFVADVRATVNGTGPGPSGCDGEKIRDAGRKAGAKAKCAARVGGFLELASECFATAESKFDAAVARAESGNDCASTGQAAELEAIVDVFINDLVGELDPQLVTTTITTTTTTTTLACQFDTVTNASYGRMPAGRAAVHVGRADELQLPAACLPDVLRHRYELLHGRSLLFACGLHRAEHPLSRRSV